MTPRTRWTAGGVLAVGIACIAWSPIFVRLAVNVSGPASAFYRALIATVVLVPIWLIRRPARPSREAILFSIAAGFAFAVDLALYNTAVLGTTAAIATLLGNTSPVTVGLGMWLVFHEEPDRSFWIGLTVALVGAVAIVGTDAYRQATFGVADVLAVVAGASFAVYIVLTNRARRHGDTLAVTTLTIAATAAFLGLFCVVLRTPLTGYRPSAWAALLGLGLISQVGGYLALTYALGRLQATVASIAMLAQVPVTALLALAILGERLTPIQLVGGAIVLAGIAIATRAPEAATRTTTADRAPAT